MTAQEDASYWYQDRQTRARLVLEALRRLPGCGVGDARARAHLNRAG